MAGTEVKPMNMLEHNNAMEDDILWAREGLCKRLSEPESSEDILQSA